MATLFRAFSSILQCDPSRDCFPSVMRPNNQEPSSDKVICDMFAGFFYLVSSSPSLDGNKVLDYLEKLKMIFSCGAVGIPNSIFKPCAELFVTPLTLLFNISISNEYFSTFWKESYIITLFKSGNTFETECYTQIV